MPVIWYEGVVRDIQNETPQVRRFWIEIPALQEFSFRSGQFITLDLPIGEKRLHRWRSYSIASRPDGSNLIELCIVRSPDGLGTQYLFEEVQPGSVLKCKGPEGGFVLPEPLHYPVVMVCTGTGIVPFRSMLADLQHRRIAHPPIHLIFGTRTEDSILYRAELEAFARDNPHFQYDIVLSRQPDWPGYQGHVHQVYLEKYPQPDPNLHFYLCGWSNMIDEAVALLFQRLHCQRTQIHYELYG